jgi:23S rRNA (uracil1939-C5)-methyltransferase
MRLHHGTNIPTDWHYLCVVGRERKFRKNEALILDVEDIAFGGKGIARITTDKGPFVVFIQNAFPGQKVEARVVKCKSKHAECRLEEVIQRSPSEVDHGFQEIPGAPYARVPLELQHKTKEKTALDLYERIGGVDDVQSVYEGFIASPKNWHYRNKMEYSFSAIVHNPKTKEKEDGFGFGFKKRGTWWAVENLNGDSGLYDAQVENFMPTLRGWFEETNLPAWHPPKREGFYRFLVARRSEANEKLLFNLVTSSDGLESFDRQAFVELLKSAFGERLQGVIHTINDDKGDRVEARSGDSELVYGQAFITETLHELNFDIEMSSFFQTNPACAERLYAEVIAAVSASDDASTGSKPFHTGEYIMDLFCGTGTIAQMLARHTGKEIIGVDIVEQAIIDARKSAKNNGTENVQFHAADVGKFLLEFPEYKGRIKSIVLDPPRAGISPKTLRKVIRLGAERLVYVSCNPATQARDIVTLRDFGYELKRLKLVDQFPHTAHVEAIAVFEKNLKASNLDE